MRFVPKGKEEDEDAMFQVRIVGFAETTGDGVAPDQMEISEFSIGRRIDDAPEEGWDDNHEEDPNRPLTAAQIEWVKENFCDNGSVDELLRQKLCTYKSHFW